MSRAAFLPTPRRISLLVLVASLPGLAGCRAPLRLTPSDHETVLAHHALDAPDPAARGPYRVRTLYYGSGEDRRRPEYRDSVTLVTRSVDGSKLVDLGRDEAERNEYWGFGPEEMPINGRVWYPDADPGEGPFPLVLVVHGNHDMRDFSDPGYDYLGELLASRGFVLASADMNFINGGIRGENDARGWLLLQHLRAWRGFASEEGSPLRGLVDMEHIALVGHSRGGEAVSVAAAFNRLDRYPDDATLEFDFGFPIEGVVALAPVDGQYLPTVRKTPLSDISYLVFHGSHDGDVTSFHGLRPYHRVRLDPGSGHFKAAVYVYRANHGQWNTVWGAHDSGPRSGRILDLRYLMPPEDQRRVVEVYLTAFLESRLRGDDRWLPLFRDHRVAGGWLPPTMYVTRFQDASFRTLADFEEDIDVTRGSAPGVELRGEGLSTWKEGRLDLRSSNWPTTSRSQENQVAWLAWGGDAAGEDAAGGDAAGDSLLSVTPSYTLALPSGLARQWRLADGASLQLALAPTERTPGASRDADPGAPVDVTLEVEDGAGVTARVPLSRYGPVRRPLEAWISRRPDLDRERFPDPWEVILQTYTIPLGDFAAGEPRLDLAGLRAVRLVFDRVPAGEVVLDDVGFTRLDPAFWSARVDGAGAAEGF